MPQRLEQPGVRTVVQNLDSGVGNTGASVASGGGIKRMGKRTAGETGMYANPDYKQGYLDAMDGKPMRDNPSSPYKAG